jgi:choline dehydrogenase-like flavoprotein
LKKKEKKIKAKVFVVAAQTIESSRLLLNSNIANSSGEVGKNLIFGGVGGLAYAKVDFDYMQKDKLMIDGLFINRTIKDFYFLDNLKLKGGVIDILFGHQNPIYRSIFQMFDKDFKPIWGKKLQQKLTREFLEVKQLNFEIFNDFLPHDNCFVTVSKKNRDIFGIPVAKVRLATHKHSYQIALRLVKKSVEILEKIGLKKENIGAKIQPFNPPKNLQAGGCRFGDDPKKSVLNRFCQSHDHKNLFVTDGSFMPTGGSVPFTWTIYANSFRVADFIKKEYLKLN